MRVVKTVAPIDAGREEHLLVADLRSKGRRLLNKQASSQVLVAESGVLVHVGMTMRLADALRDLWRTQFGRQRHPGDSMQVYVREVLERAALDLYAPPASS